jgi:hypothetical protein
LAFFANFYFTVLMAGQAVISPFSVDSSGLCYKTDEKENCLEGPALGGTFPVKFESEKYEKTLIACFK